MASMERMRCRCRIPKDVVAVYEGLNKVGLQYGPAFRLLTDGALRTRAGSGAAAGVIGPEVTG